MGCIEMLQRGSGGKRNKWLDFGSNFNHHADCPITSWSIKVSIAAPNLRAQDGSIRNPVITEQISRGVSWILLG